MVKIILSGNYAAAYAAKLARVNVVAAYPITPQTQIVEKLAEFIENGELNAKYIRVESEHSAMAACIGAAAVGARPFTATSSQGLIYMSEMLWWAAGARLPIVMGVVTRALAPPWSIWSDHSDILSQRDTGWLIFFAESAQEVLDMILQAYKISENENVLLPIAVVWDAFYISHSYEPVEVPEQDKVDRFLPLRKRYAHILDVKNPFSHGNLVFPDKYMEYRYDINVASIFSKKIIEEVDKEYSKLFGRGYGGLVERYRCEDAEYVFISVGSFSGDIKEAVDILRKKGIKVGFLRIRCIRPFPSEDIKRIAESVYGIIVIERDYSFGKGGILSTEIKSELYMSKIPIISYIAGIGGRDVGYKDFIKIFQKSYKYFSSGKIVEKPIWYGLKVVK
ncbi:MAG TPA: pyruvate ferredoxin oxidoreductase [Thermoprotei archaeon]|nr:pyruvate ferredoxin oxidoreductase [Thermoprotei archaeon]